MKGDSLLFGILVFTSVFWFGCSSNSESPIIDCSLSGLVLMVVNQTASDCADPGSLTVQASGGTSPYQYSADGIDFQTSETLGSLFAGSFTLIVRDANGCTASTKAVVETAAGSVSVEVDFTSPDCGSDNGTITVSAVGGSSPYMFSLNGGTPQPSNTFIGVINGSNTVSVNDANNCEVERTIAVTTGLSLSNDIMPIIQSNCSVTGCHDGSRSPDLRTSAGIVTSSTRIKARTSAGTMPPAGRSNLSQEDIAKIACWVDDGAPES
ncbi:MAG: SprB repeat-containing protein [Cyclobacteriaceae bacterium]